ncbi:tektin-3 isoform X1 [Nomia melanderi]|uniref:tektin-3 isoform X1 n=1 Tax=Nomia melanderi TaxID=2448451 RepID=UPI003FCE2E90
MDIQNNMDILGIRKRELQPWSRNTVPSSFIESARRYCSKDYNNTHNLIPWRQNVGYENVEILPFASRVTNTVSENSAGNGITPLKFPNLLTGYDRNPAHATTTALHTRYTPNEWFEKQVKSYNEADSCRHFSERIRNDALRVIREAEEKVQHGQYDTGRRLGERINDVNFWRNEVASELERLLQEIERVQDCRSVLEKAIKDIEAPIHIAEECLYHREARKGIELVHDDLEKCLLKEMETLHRNKKKLEACLDTCKEQLRDCRASQNQLELDLKNKENALGIDSMCHRLNNYSHGLQYYSRIDENEYDLCDFSVSEQETWMDAANRIVEKSRTKRNKCSQLRSNAEVLTTKVAQEMWDAWNNTNNALAYRSSELLEAKTKLEQHLQKVQQEIFEIEKNLELMNKAIADKSYVIKVAHTRLEARMHRPEIELCRDYAHMSLRKEIDDIHHQVERMQKALKELENQQQKLLRTRLTLEHDLALKIDAIYIDREKVSGLRRAYPINVLFKF